MTGGHQRNDLQSLRLTEAAIDSIRLQPKLLEKALATLDHWDRVAPAQSKPLRDQWRQILQSRDWSSALDPGPKGQQLRQASPLGKALTPAQRMHIIRECRGRNSNT